MKCLPMFTTVLLTTFAACQLEPPKPPPKTEVKVEPKPQDPQQLLQEVLQQFQKEGIELDAKAQTLTIKAVVNHSQDPLEYLLIHRRGKKHEACAPEPRRPFHPRKAERKHQSRADGHGERP